MTTDTPTSKPLPWRRVKARLIERFGTVTAGATKFECSVSALRQAAEGKGCRGVRQQLTEAGIL